MPVQTWAAVLNEPYVADGAAYASSTSATDVNPTPNLVIPANYLMPGSALLMIASGKFSTTSTPTLTVGSYWGGVAGTAICTSGAITTGSGVSNLSFFYQALLICRSVGSSGSIFGSGTLTLGTSTSAAAAYAVPQSAPAVVGSLDTTAAKALTFGATWGTNSASNTLTVNNFSVVQLY